MPCDDDDHHHPWPKAGLLNIASCERYCAYCPHQRTKPYQNARILRLHILNCHLGPDGEYPGVTLVKAKPGRPRRDPQDFRPKNLNSVLKNAVSFSSEVSSTRGKDVEMLDLGEHDETDTPAAKRVRIANERRAKKKAQDQIRVSAAIPMVYESSPSPDSDLDETELEFSDETATKVNLPPQPARRKRGRPRKDAQVSSSTFSRPPVEQSRLIQVHSRRTPSPMEDLQEDVLSTPQKKEKSLEAQKRLQQHMDRRERGLAQPRKPQKKLVKPMWDYSQLWIDEFVPAERGGKGRICGPFGLA